MIIGGLNVKTENLKDKEVFRIRQVSKLVKQLTGQELIEFLNNRNWGLDTNFAINILQGDINNKNDELAYKVVKDINNINSMKDTRSYSEFIRNLILGWITEDATLEKLKILGLNASLFEDKTNMRSLGKRARSKPDLKIDFPQNKTIYVEIIQTYISEVSEKGVIRLRHNKFKHLKEYNSDIILYDLHSDELKFALFNIENANNTTKDNNVMSTKSGYKIKIDYNKYSHPITEFDEIIKNRYLQNTKAMD